MLGMNPYIVMQVPYLPRVVIKSEEKRLVFAEVYSPMHVDTDGEAMSADEIEKMAHRFLASGRVGNVDVTHNYQKSGCVIVESFIARKSDADGFVEGSWVLGVKVVPDELWEAVKKGELNGFSFAGEVKKIPVTAKVLLTKRLEGESEKAEVEGVVEEHSHPIEIAFDVEGKVSLGVAKFASGHEHPITRLTATDEVLQHRHRLIVVND